jgi:hypothetical protein
VTLFATDELTSLRTCQTAFMADSCQVGTITKTQSATGDMVDGDPAYAAEVVCGLGQVSGFERSEYRNGAMTIVKADAKIRLPYGTVIGATNVVKVTKRQGTAITPIVYEVMGEPAVGATGIVCYLRKVTT